MNSRLRFHSILALATAALFAGCSTSPLSRIDANRALYETWPLEVQQAVLDGRAEKGMTHDQVMMSIGKPTEVQTRVARGGDEEVWIYRKGGGGSLLPKNMSLGGSIGGIGVGTGGGGSSSGIAEEREVVFKKGVVVRSDFGAEGNRPGR
jgi:hypothetical protein